MRKLEPYHIGMVVDKSETKDFIGPDIKPFADNKSAEEIFQEKYDVRALSSFVRFQNF